MRKEADGAACRLSDCVRFVHASNACRKSSGHSSYPSYSRTLPQHRLSGARGLCQRGPSVRKYWALVSQHLSILSRQAENIRRRSRLISWLTVGGAASQACDQKVRFLSCMSISPLWMFFRCVCYCGQIITNFAIEFNALLLPVHSKDTKIHLRIYLYKKRQSHAFYAIIITPLEFSQAKGNPIINFDFLVAGCNTRCQHCYVNGGPAP